MRKYGLVILFLITTFLICQMSEVQVYGLEPRIKIQEIDGSPSGRPRVLKITNGLLTDNGGGKFTLEIDKYDTGVQTTTPGKNMGNSGTAANPILDMNVNDSATSDTEPWSASKIIAELDDKADVADSTLFIWKDGSQDFTANQSMGGFKLTDSGEPTADSDLITKFYGDSNYLTDYAQTVTVAKSGGDYTTIQAAVDSISDSADGKRYLIKIYPGSYVGVNIGGKGYITFEGVGVGFGGKPAVQVTLVAPGGYYYFFDGLEEGVTLKNLSMVGSQSDKHIHAIRTNHPHWIIENCYMDITGIDGKDCRGIYGTAGQVTIKNCYIKVSGCSDLGIGVYIRYGDRSEIWNSYIDSSNEGIYGRDSTFRGYIYNSYIKGVNQAILTSSSSITRIYNSAIDGLLQGGTFNLYNSHFDTFTSATINRMTKAHTILNVAAGNIAATDVQSAINELDDEKAGIAEDKTITGLWRFDAMILTPKALADSPTSPEEGHFWWDSTVADTGPKVYLGGKWCKLLTNEGGYTRTIKIPATAARVGVTAPTPTTIENTRGLGFDADGELAFIATPIPQDWNGASDLIFRTSFCGTSGDAIADTETVKFDISYNSVTEGEAVDNGTEKTATVTYTQSGAGTDKEMIIVNITIDYDNADQPITAGDALFIKFNRDVTTDTYSGAAIVQAWALQYTSDDVPK